MASCVIGYTLQRIVHIFCLETWKNSTIANLNFNRKDIEMVNCIELFLRISKYSNYIKNGNIRISIVIDYRTVSILITNIINEFINIIIVHFCLLV